MTIPLEACNFVEKDSPKFGNLKDKYYKQQDINNCLEEAEKEMELRFGKYIKTIEIKKILEKWLMT